MPVSCRSLIPRRCEAQCPEPPLSELRQDRIFLAIGSHPHPGLRPPGYPPHIACATAQAISRRPSIRSTHERVFEDAFMHSRLHQLGRRTFPFCPGSVPYSSWHVSRARRFPSPAGDSVLAEFASARRRIDPWLRTPHVVNPTFKKERPVRSPRAGPYGSCSNQSLRCFSSPLTGYSRFLNLLSCLPERSG